MAGGVGDELGAEDLLAAGLSVDGLHGGDAVAVHDDTRGEVAEEEADVLLLADDLLLEFVAEAVDAARAVGGAVADFFDDLSEVPDICRGWCRPWPRRRSRSCRCRRGRNGLG
jgi:plasmid stabilization system protein ParE